MITQLKRTMPVVDERLNMSERLESWVQDITRQVNFNTISRAAAERSLRLYSEHVMPRVAAL